MVMPEEIFIGSSETGALMRSLDWSQTPLGAVETWPQSLRSTLSICLNSRFPIAIYWGADFLLLYNDAWRPIVGDKHPWAIGRPAHEVWSEIWEDIGPELAGVLATGEGTFHHDELLSMHRFGYTEECFFEYTFNPIQGQGGVIDGVFNVVSETTYRVLSERRARLLRETAAKTGVAKTLEEACALVVEALKSDPLDIPFALLYLVDSNGEQARLCGSTKLLQDHRISPEIVHLTAETSDWEIARAAHTAQPQEIHNLSDRVGEIPGSPWSEPPQEAMVLPIVAAGQDKATGVLVAVASPRRRLDDHYRDFFNQIATQIGSAMTNAQAYEAERQRAEALAELDRAKTTFFSNVSHEFRTPLTLMLSPLEQLSSSLNGQLQPDQWEQLQLIQRNGLRLQKLVNTLLDFSRIEVGRVQVSYEATDLAAYTAELASVFRSLIEQAGMALVIDCPALPELVYVDRDIWEKILLNLLSNAFKFTFTGSITVRLQPVGNFVELSVTDTGVGIPEVELPRLFERFHRVSGTQSRTYEGSGIGLALVQELVKLHGGTIHVTSQVDRGTTFTVAIPFGTAHLSQERIVATRPLIPIPLAANSYVVEASRWIPDAAIAASKFLNPELAIAIPAQLKQSTTPTARVLLVDDNADMRDYVKRLLNQYWEVETVSDGLAALKVIAQRPPNLVLSDVMMPGLDGFGLLRELRANPMTQNIPVILLSARAGEEARIEGLAAEADDYLTKPFSARELLARVEVNLKLAQLRQTAAQQEQALRVEVQAARDRLENVLTRIADQFLALDRDWRYTYVNDRVTEVIGIPRENLLGQNVWELFPDLIGSQFEVEVRRAVAEQTPIQFEYFYPNWNRWFENHVYPSVDGVSLIVTEITDRKQAEAEREQLLAQEQAAREEAEQANRIKDEFLAVLSHELRSPLNPILGWAKLLQSGKLDATKTAQALATIERNAKLQAELIEDLLDVSRILRGKLSLNVAPVNLAVVIKEALETIRLAAEAKSIPIAATLASEVGLVLGDSTRLQQVVWNLLSNAVKFTSPGGQVSIQLERVDSSAQITVSDTGQGITPDFLPYVFDYFRQADAATTRKFGGLGLGLAIVRHLVELHGGKVAVTSPGVGLGATFTVRLPLQPIQTAAEQNHQSLDLSADLAGIRVLVVDDDPDSREFVAFVLEQARATVITATMANEALSLLIQSKPDVLLSDIGMPEVDGYTLMQWVRALLPEQGGQIPAIALTAYAGELDQQQALSVGFQRHVAKPVEPEQLVRAILSLLENPTIAKLQ